MRVSLTSSASFVQFSWARKLRDVTQMMSVMPGVKAQRPIKTNLSQFRMRERSRKVGIVQRMEKRSPARMKAL